MFTIKILFTFLTLYDEVLKYTEIYVHTIFLSKGQKSRFKLLVSKITEFSNNNCLSNFLALNYSHLYGRTLKPHSFNSKITSSYNFHSPIKVRIFYVNYIKLKCKTCYYVIMSKN